MKIRLGAFLACWFLFTGPAWANTDADGDGLSDSREAQFGSDPNNADSDGGGLSDFLEYQLNLDPNDGNDDVPCVAPASNDCDGDGLSNDREAWLGSDPLNPDTDGGGVDDGAEYDVGNNLLLSEDDALAGVSGGALGGCEMTGTGSSAALLLMLALFFIGRRRWVGAVAALAVCAALPRSAMAQDKVDAQTFRPMPNLFDHHLHTIAPHRIDGDQWVFGLLGQFEDDPLVVNDLDDERVGALVHQRITAHVLGSLSYGGIVEIGLDVPVILYATGDDDIDGFGPQDTLNANVALGDPRVIPKLVLYSDVTEESPAGNSLALAGDFYLPVGDRDNFAGEPFRAEPRLAYGYQWAGGSSFAINTGYQFRESRRYRGVNVDDLLTYSAAFDIATDAGVHIVPEINGGYAVLSDSFEAEENPLEGLLAIKWFATDEAMLIAGGGIGILKGVGVPDYRAFAGFQFLGTEEEPPPPDSDGDGIDDDEDKCPNDPEDMDGFQDADGCPEADNDQDGIKDADDKCPNEPEDLDGDADEDGCPEEAQDKDGDGILDADDKCVDEPEDKDEFEDADGCPDPDNDKDKILDKDDKCPNKAEVYNEFEDEDGCPDEAKVKITCEKIELNEKVFFETGKAEVQVRSKPLLSQVAGAMKKHPEILKVRVEGHTDSVGSDKSNKKLSQARVDAVVGFLTGKGIEAGRLVAKGYGEKKPIADNKTEDGRAKNRRVELVILERDKSKECKVEPAK